MRESGFRLLQTVILACCLYLVVSAWKSGDFGSIVIELIIISSSLAQLFAPTPDQVAQKKISELRRQGIYPLEGHGTDEDVRQLAKEGQRIYAIRLYREIHNVPLKEAANFVKRLA